MERGTYFFIFFIIVSIAIQLYSQNQDKDTKVKDLTKKLEKIDNDLRKEILEFFKGMTGYTETKQISIDENMEMFKKKSHVPKNETLDMKGLDLIVLNDQLKTRFSVKPQNSVVLTIMDKKGEEVYKKFYDRFEGTFIDHINFSYYDNGDYLLVINVGNKCLVRHLSVS